MIFRSHRLGVRSSLFHSEDTGSNPVGSARLKPCKYNVYRAFSSLAKIPLALSLALFSKLIEIYYIQIVSD